MAKPKKIPYSLKTEEEKKIQRKWLDGFLITCFVGIIINAFLERYYSIGFISYFVATLIIISGIIFTIKIFAVQIRTKRIGWFVASWFLSPFAILIYYFGLYRPFLSCRKKIEDIEIKEETKPLKDSEKRCPYCKYNCPKELYEKHLKNCDKNPDN